MGSDHQDPSGHMKTSSTSSTVWSQPGGKRIQIENVRRRRCPSSRTFPERNPVKIPTERKKEFLRSPPLLSFLTLKILPIAAVPKRSIYVRNSESDAERRFFLNYLSSASEFRECGNRYLLASVVSIMSWGLAAMAFASKRGDEYVISPLFSLGAQFCWNHDDDDARTDFPFISGHSSSEHTCISSVLIAALLVNSARGEGGRIRGANKP